MKKKPWNEMSEKDILRLKRDQCIKCAYLSGQIGGNKRASSNRVCDYIAIEGHRRGCSPLECIEKGIFKPKKGGGRNAQKQ